LAIKRDIASKRKASNEDIKIYNKVSSMKCNPFAGDTTVLDRTVDNRRDNVPQTEEEILSSVLNPKHNYRVKKSDVKLCPDMVTEEIKDYFLQKIRGSALRSARSYNKMTRTDNLVAQEKV
jgi:hypothetical protein